MRRRSRSRIDELMEYLLLQMLNGVQLGLLMFLLAAGLTLTLGIMDSASTWRTARST